MSNRNNCNHDITNYNKTCTAKHFRSKVSNIRTWNVQTLFKAGKPDNVIHEMDRMRINCLGLQEVRWPGAGDFYKDKKRVFYSGMEKEHKYGVGPILDSYFSKAVLSFWPKSERILLVKLKASPCIQCQHHCSLCSQCRSRRHRHR